MYFCQQIVGLLNPLKLAVLDSKKLKKLAKRELDKCLEEKKTEDLFTSWNNSGTDLLIENI